MTSAAAPSGLRLSLAILAATALLGVLYLGRPVLVPVTLAVVLSFALSPLVRVLRRTGLGQVGATLAAELAVAFAIAAVGLAIGLQLRGLVAELPTYRATLQANMQGMKRATLAGLDALGAVDQLLDLSAPERPGLEPPAPALVGAGVAAGGGSASLSAERVGGLVARILAPVAAAGVVLLVVVFVLLEQEALRDRFIRLVGDGDLRATTSAINDAGERLSRYLMRQAAVNLAVGCASGLALACIGLPGAAVIGLLVALARFVPFVGVPAVAVVTALFGLAAAPGWGAMALSVAAVLALHGVTSQVIEPRLYGHATGLSRLSIVLAALFWGALWGGVGVLISTPLTLCLAVAGRHVRSLDDLDVLLGDGPALSLAQKLYQRALSGDAREIVAGGRAFLRRRSFGAWCDTVLLPALQLCHEDFASGEITLEQQGRMRAVLVEVVEALDGTPRHGVARRRVPTVLGDGSSGRVLRSRRLLHQHGAPAATPEALVLCIGLDAPGDDLVTELLVRMLRGLGIDAQHLGAAELRAPRAPGAPRPAIAAVCIVSGTPGRQREAGARLARDIGAGLPGVRIVALALPGLRPAGVATALAGVVDRALVSFEDATLEFRERHAA
ncbi:MAG: AI-2E family transporter [Betaproteobacteria bacterium]